MLVLVRRQWLTITLMQKQRLHAPERVLWTIGALLITGFAARAQDKALAHFHHLHLNSTDPQAAIAFYTSKFDCEKGKFAGAVDAVWAQKSWILFTKVNQPPPSEIVSALYHFGWGAEDPNSAYLRQ